MYENVHANGRENGRENVAVEVHENGRENAAVRPQMNVGVDVRKCTRKWPRKCSCRK